MERIDWAEGGERNGWEGYGGGKGEKVGWVDGLVRMGLMMKRNKCDVIRLEMKISN